MTLIVIRIIFDIVSMLHFPICINLVVSFHRRSLNSTSATVKLTLSNRLTRSVGRMDFIRGIGNMFNFKWLRGIYSLI